MKTGRGWKAYALLVAALTGVGGAAGAAGVAGAQQGDDCRCVDRDGNEIENCTCLVMPRVDDIVASFMPMRPRLGISVTTDQPSGLDAQGAEVTSVLEDGPAESAGIQEGDIITGIDGRSLVEPLDAEIEEDLDEDESLPAQRLLALARELEPGEQVEVEYLRDGERRTATIEAEDLSFRGFSYDFAPERLRSRMQAMESLRDLRSQPVMAYALGWGGAARYGIEIVELNPGLADYFGVEEGVLVTDVDADSPLGLEPGDVVLSVGDRPVTTPERLLRLLATYDEDEVVNLRVRRDQAEIAVQGRIEG